MSNTTTGVSRLVRGLGMSLLGALGTFVALLIVVAVLATTDEGGVTRVVGHPVMTVLSDSMVPTFRAGDLVVEDSIGDNADRLAEGNVITFRMREGRDELVTHRIVGVTGTPSEGNVQYRTQGDANNAPDLTPVSPEQVVGVYSWRIPYAGYVLDVARSPKVMFLLIFIPALLLLLPLLAKWWRTAGEPTRDAGATGVVERPVGTREGETNQLETQL